MRQDPAWQARVKALCANRPKGSDTLGQPIADKPVSKRAQAKTVPGQTRQQQLIQRDLMLLQSEDVSQQSAALSSADSEQSDPGVSLSSTGTVTFGNPAAARSSRSGKKKSNRSLDSMSTPLSFDFHNDGQNDGSMNAVDSAFEDAGKEGVARKKSGGFFGCCGRQNND